ncbi:hypothetical protein [Microbispora siamensis]|uniref:Major facilitator superfamily (MFS) profile domain-containing protein n=1 Tax=Microbispora siamensis TaxID=564413 RepID=A0ABQ4H0Q3_9ACTN|nr:hypothetical protein [Microbispora siamensis]GIH67261.1 hypothetical protein Msi02_80780 [Microbispora siamensis]
MVLASVGRSLGVDADTAGLVVVAALTGNALAQVLVVPLVDQVEQRRLSRIVLAAHLSGPAYGYTDAIIGLLGAAGRVTTAYMGSNVVAGALGSAAATRLSSYAGWPALSVAGFTCGALALLILRVSPATASA